MSYAPYPSQPPPGPVVGPPEEPNNAAVVGFILSAAGLFFCGGLLCPIGLVLSVMGLRKRNNQGMAIAGLILGIIGTVGLVIAVIYIIVAFAAVAALFGIAVESVSERAETFDEIRKAQEVIERSVRESEEKELPADEDGTQLIKEFKDSWGNPLRYRRDPVRPREYTIFSAGPDGQYENGDDIKKLYNSSTAREKRNAVPAPTPTNVLTPWPPKI